MLSIEGLHTYYGDLHVLNGVSMEVNQGEVVTVLGANGAGKSTLLKAIMGVARSRQGKISYLGRDVTNSAAEDLVPLGLCLVPEGRELFTNLSVLDNLRLGAFSLRKRQSKQQFQESLDLVFNLFPALKGRERQLAGTLSGGERQMLAIGRGLMSKPRLLMLDEPTIGLSPLVVQEIFGTIGKLKAQGSTILMVEQNTKVALKVADRGYVLQRGEIALADTAPNLLANENVREMYLGKARSAS